MVTTRNILVILLAVLTTSCGNILDTDREDTSKYVLVADSLYNADPEEALSAEYKCKSEEDRQRMNLTQARAHFLRGINSPDHLARELKDAHSLIIECVNYYDSLTYYQPSYVAFHLMALRIYADILRTSGRLPEAVTMYRQASEIARAIGKFDYYVEDMNHVHRYEAVTGKYSDAIDGLENLVKICDENGFKEKKFDLLDQLISVYLTIDDPEKATELLDKMIQITSKRDTLRRAQTDLNKMQIAITAEDEQNMRVMALRLRKMLLDTVVVGKHFGTEINTLLAEYYLHKKNNAHAQIHIDNLLKEGRTDYYSLLQAHLAKNRDNIDESLRILGEFDKNKLSKDIILYERYLQLLSDAYFKQGNYSQSYELFRQRLALTDVLQKDKIAQDYAYKSLDFRRDTTILAQHYDIQQRQIELQSLRLWRRVFVTVAIIVIIVTLIVFFYTRMLFMRRRVKEIAIQNEKLQREVVRQTTILKKQEEELMVRKNEMTSQIVYASQIQHHILPDIATFDSPYIKDAFILFRPCQIVSGDFYWCKEKNDKQIIVCADATGHGIPGAFVAMVCATILNNIEHVEDDNTTVAILEYLDLNIRTILHGNNTANENDSLDISILCIDNLTGKMSIGTARQSAYLIKKNGEQIRLSGAHRSIGDTHPKYMTREFTQSFLDVDDDDMLFITSDGYESQLGGPDGKKLKRQKMVDIFLNIANKDAEMQKKILEQELDIWRGDNDQTDDVSVIGIRFKSSKL